MAEAVFSVTGDRNAGKTTLLLKMMLDGAEMHCDETVLLHDGLIQTFPRKFYIKEETLQHLPRIREICAAKRSYPAFFGWGPFLFCGPDGSGPALAKRGSTPLGHFPSDTRLRSTTPS